MNDNGEEFPILINDLHHCHRFLALLVTVVWHRKFVSVWHSDAEEVERKQVLGLRLIKRLSKTKTHRKVLLVSKSPLDNVSEWERICLSSFIKSSFSAVDKWRISSSRLTGWKTLSSMFSSFSSVSDSDRRCLPWSTRFVFFLNMCRDEWSGEHCLVLSLSLPVPFEELRSSWCTTNSIKITNCVFLSGICTLATWIRRRRMEFFSLSLSRRGFSREMTMMEWLT